jgi:surface antigen
MSDNTMAKKYQRSNQNSRKYNGQKIPKKYSEFQTIQWPKDTKEVIRMPENTMAKRYQRSNQNARKYNGQKIPKK